MNPRTICHAEVSLTALSHNLGVIQKRRPNAEIVAMVKANAYGHGAVQIARHLSSEGVKWFGVATVNEGVELRERGIEERILLMAGAGAQYALPELLHFGLTPLISSASELNEFDAAVGQSDIAAPFAVHVDVDTGMTRGGFLGLKAQDLALTSQRLFIEGVSTHFAKAEQNSCAFTDEQLRTFRNHLQVIASCGHQPSIIHVDKSASILTHNLTNFDGYKVLVRPGISLYGVDPTQGQAFASDLRPLLSWKAPIVVRKHISEGTSVGYDCTFVAQKPMEVALVRVGYADGLNRQLSNRGHLIVADRKAPILGRISMDLTVVDVSEICASKGREACDVGQYAHIIGGGPNIQQTASMLAQDCGTIPYEILTWISPRVERVFV